MLIIETVLVFRALSLPYVLWKNFHTLRKHLILLQKFNIGIENASQLQQPHQLHRAHGKTFKFQVGSLFCFNLLVELESSVLFASLEILLKFHLTYVY